MKTRLFASLLLLASGVAAWSAEIELTGLVEIGGCRMACLRVLPGGECIVLRKGDSAHGVTLRELNARAGWAQLEINGAPARVRLFNFCAARSTAPTQNGETAKSVRGLRGRAFLNGPEVRMSMADTRGPGVEFRNESAPPGAVGLLGGPKPRPDAAGTSSSAPAENASPDQSVEHGPAPVKTEDPGVSPQPEDLFADRRRAYESALESDPSYQEGEQIKLLYGLQGFLAWDLARGQDALEGK